MKRNIFHDKDSILNVMTLEITDQDKLSPHYNKERDEVIFVLNGDINIHFDFSKKIFLSSKDDEPWYLIKANTTHNIECLTSKVKLLEVIGGIHKNDSSIMKQFKK